MILIYLLFWHHCLTNILFQVIFKQHYVAVRRETFDFIESVSDIFNYFLDEVPIDSKISILLTDWYSIGVERDKWEPIFGVDSFSFCVPFSNVSFVWAFLFFYNQLQVIAEQIAHESKLVFEDCFQELVISTVQVIENPLMEKC